MLYLIKFHFIILYIICVLFVIIKKGENVDILSPTLLVLMINKQISSHNLCR